MYILYVHTFLYINTYIQFIKVYVHKLSCKVYLHCTCTNTVIINTLIKFNNISQDNMFMLYINWKLVVLPIPTVVGQVIS